VRLAASGSFLDAQLREPGLDGLGHAAEAFDFLDVRPGAAHERVGERLDIERAAPRINDLGDAGLLLQEQLRVARDARGKVRRQRDGLVE
jgi:hypothetical protein